MFLPYSRGYLVELWGFGQKPKLQHAFDQHFLGCARRDFEASLAPEITSNPGKLLGSETLLAPQTA